MRLRIITDKVTDMTGKYTVDGVYSIKDLIFLNASPEDVEAMRVRIEDYLAWLKQMGLENTMDTWQSFCEMCNNED